MMFPTGSTNGSSRAAIRPSRLALKRSVTLTLALASRSSLAASTFPLRATCLNAVSTSALVESRSALGFPYSTSPDGGAGAILCTNCRTLPGEEDQILVRLDAAYANDIIGR